jgi:uncharacterized protein
MTHLLDVNVLLALAWPGHQFHTTAQKWFSQHAPQGWATCPMTEAGFVRIISNPGFSPRAVSTAEALAALSVNVKHPSHQFWPDDISLTQLPKSLQTKLTGHKQVTDLYLLALAQHHQGKLATLDRTLIAATGKGGGEGIHVVLVQ